MKFSSLFKKKENLVSIDIGSTAIKLLEMDLNAVKPVLQSLSLAPSGGDPFNGNQIGKADLVAEKISVLCETSNINQLRYCTAVPSGSTFCKRITVDQMTADELHEYIENESASIIPQDVSSLKIDHHIIGKAEAGEMDVLVVAVKNEVVESLLDVFSLVGLEPAVIDIEHFALQNCFEFNYPQELQKTSCLVNLGARYSSVNIVSKGESLFSGTVSVGGKAITEAIAAAKNLSIEDAEKIKKKASSDPRALTAIRGVIDEEVEKIASELARQLSFFWSSVGSDDEMQSVFVSGGTSLLPGLVERIQEKVEIPCERLNPFKNLGVSPSLDADALDVLAPFMGVAVGLGLRQAGDRVSLEEISN